MPLSSNVHAVFDKKQIDLKDFRSKLTCWRSTPARPPPSWKSWIGHRCTHINTSETSKASESLLKLKTNFLANIWYESVSLASIPAYTVTSIIKLPLFYALLISSNPVH